MSRRRHSALASKLPVTFEAELTITDGKPLHKNTGETASKVFEMVGGTGIEPLPCRCYSGENYFVRIARDKKNKT